MQDKDKKNTEENGEDVVFDESLAEEGEAGFGKGSVEKIKKLKDELKACQKEKQEYLDGWQRAKADFINARKEEEKNRAQVAQFAKEGMLHEILPVVDSFDMAFRDKEAWARVDENWRKGVEYIYQQFVSILENNGLAPIESLGKHFDPTLHSPIESVPVEEKDKDGIVLEVVQKGYRMNDRVLRPAKVKIGVFGKVS
ncbi:MAG: nucleotide exchange factor GrpE [Parcubacteria group bacterium]|nr:nucleotide exchange factor GrpE [Parcubacteria group bacterium]